ncbi:hypothetical protein B7486_13400 [cyanobacterium TDX16]|nr:hypothetical protein B7486_13400 [cyanobacterium TDX16]
MPPTLAAASLRSCLLAVLFARSCTRSDLSCPFAALGRAIYFTRLTHLRKIARPWLLPQGPATTGTSEQEAIPQTSESLVESCTKKYSHVIAFFEKTDLNFLLRTIGPSLSRVLCQDWLEVTNENTTRGLKTLMLSCPNAACCPQEYRRESNHYSLIGRLFFRGDRRMPLEIDDISSLLTDVNQDKAGAMDALIAAAYEDLRATAKRILKGQVRPGRPGDTLQPTALVNEAFLKLIKEGLRLERRGQFFMAFSTCMRQVLLDYIRGQKAEKRGGAWTRVAFDSDAPDSDSTTDPRAFEEALQKLERLDSRKAKAVELRFFCGMTLQEIADALNVSRATIERDWEFARAWLRKELAGDST